MREVKIVPKKKLWSSPRSPLERFIRRIFPSSIIFWILMVVCSWSKMCLDILEEIKDPSLWVKGAVTEDNCMLPIRANSFCQNCFKTGSLRVKAINFWSLWGHVRLIMKMQFANMFLSWPSCNLRCKKSFWCFCCCRCYNYWRSKWVNRKNCR